METLIVAGIGPGSLEYVLPEVVSWVERAQVLVGGRRALKLFPDFSGKKLKVTKRYRQLFSEIRAALKAKQTVVVLVSGDPGLFSLLDPLSREFPGQLKIIPGISSLQFAAARLKKSWHDAKVMNIHHRVPNDFLEKLKNHKKLFILTSPKYDAVYIFDRLMESGILNCHIGVCVDLSTEDEQIFEADLSLLTKKELAELREQLRELNQRLVVFYIEKKE